LGQLGKDEEKQISIIITPIFAQNVSFLRAAEVTPSLDKPKATTEMIIDWPSCPRCELSYLLPGILAFLLPNLPTAIFAIHNTSDLMKYSEKSP
jgi:hypothetical protein